MSLGIAASRMVLLGTDNDDGTVTGVITGTSVPVNRAGVGILSIYLRSIGTTSGGTILIEEAEWGPNEHVYSGTWSVIATVSASAFTGTAQQAYHVTNCAYGFVRVRISSTITGGGTVYAAMRSQGNS